MKIYLSRPEEGFQLWLDKKNRAVFAEADAKIPLEAKKALLQFKKLQSLLEGDAEVAIELLMSQCFELGRKFRP